MSKYHTGEVLKAIAFARAQHRGSAGASEFDHVLDTIELLRKFHAGAEYGNAVYVVAALHGVLDGTLCTAQQLEDSFPDASRFCHYLATPIECQGDHAHQIGVMRDAATPDLVRAVKIACLAVHVGDLERHEPPEALSWCTSTLVQAREVVEAADARGTTRPVMELAASFGATLFRAQRYVNGRAAIAEIDLELDIDTKPRHG